MDFVSARAAIHGILRERMGEPISIVAMREGKMSAVADPDRDRMDDVPARYDVAVDTEALGDGRRSRGSMVADDEMPSVSVELAKLAWVPKTGDHVVRMPPDGGGPVTYRITRLWRPQPGILLLYIQRF